MRTRRVLTNLTQALVGIALPVALVLGAVFAVASDALIRHEYSKPDFPADVYTSNSGYALPREEREALARLGLQSVLQPDGIRLLEEARFEQTGGLAFNEREIRHMRDVNVLFQGARGVLWGAVAVVVAGSGLLLGLGERRALARSLWLSSVTSLVLFVGLGLLIAVGFNVFFTAFHRVFFEGDTWLFLNSDTLIRIYPQKFWFDVSLYLSGGVLAALALIAAGSRVALARSAAR